MQGVIVAFHEKRIQVFGKKHHLRRHYVKQRPYQETNIRTDCLALNFTNVRLSLTTPLKTNP